MMNKDDCEVLETHQEFDENFLDTAGRVSALDLRSL